MTPGDILATYQSAGDADRVHTVIGSAGIPWVVDAVLGIKFDLDIPNWQHAVYLVDEATRPVPERWLEHPKLRGGEHVFMGDGATDRFRDFFIEHELRPLPAVGFLVAPRLQVAIRAVMEHRVRELHRALDVMAARDTPERYAEVLDVLATLDEGGRAPNPDERIAVWVDPSCMAERYRP